VDLAAHDLLECGDSSPLWISAGGSMKPSTLPLILFVSIPFIAAARFIGAQKG
jgi:hypothetical protein